jgi:DNA-binding transcriptional ArsR family regulator
VTTDVFQAIANSTRRELLSLLRGGELPATVLGERFDLTQPAISQQLRVLRDAGLVAERRVGRQRLYHLNPTPLREVAAWIAQYERFWDEAFDRLGDVLRDQGNQRSTTTQPRRQSAAARRRQKGSRR